MKTSISEYFQVLFSNLERNFPQQFTIENNERK